MPKHRSARMAPVFGALRYEGVSSEKRRVTGTRVPRAKLGAVVATVARRLVPNYSAAMVTKMAQ